jgi:hypothetical protein
MLVVSPPGASGTKDGRSTVRNCVLILGQSSCLESVDHGSGGPVLLQHCASIWGWAVRDTAHPTTTISHDNAQVSQSEIISKCMRNLFHHLRFPKSKPIDRFRVIFWPWFDFNHHNYPAGYVIGNHWALLLRMLEYLRKIRDSCRLVDAYSTSN